jgi:osmotically inducible protein OsmC
MKRTSTARWDGDLKEGKGVFSTPSGSMTNVPYSYEGRFGENNGTNPEELVAAAHASCFSMAFAAELSKTGLVPRTIQTDSSLDFEKKGAGWEVTGAHLKVYAYVPGTSSEHLKHIAEEARANCPISKLLNVRVTMEAELEGDDNPKPQLQETG